MKIRYLGHSSFLITGENVRIVTDPYDSSVGYKMPRVEADVVTVSHRHYDHDCVQAVSGSPAVFCAKGGKVGGVEIVAIDSFHDNKRGILRGENTIFKFMLDGLWVCHMGDLGEDYSQELVQRIGRVNVLLIPVGGNYTIDADMAKKYVDAIKPDFVIPMHYRLAGCKINIDTADKFLSLCGGVEVSVDETELTARDLGGDDTKIILMNRSCD